ncbi:proline--tRNA ligase [Patescibacteria group bacterium]
MKVSRLFGKTVKKVPRDIQVKSHELLYKGGFIRELAAGRYEFLPLGFRVWNKVLRIIEREMNILGCQRVITPTLHPIEVWKETNRDKAYGKALMRVKDRRGAEFAIGATAEGVFVDMFRQAHPSYKDLPIYLYQFSSKFRDEPRARGGLLRVREFTMKDAYSFDRTEEDFLRTYEAFKKSYLKIAKRLGLEVIVVESDSGELGGDYAHEFMVPSKVGSDTILICECGYAANVETAEFICDSKNSKGTIAEMQEKEAKRGPTIADGVKFYGSPACQQIKTVIYSTDKGEFVAAVIRGDLGINEIKLKNALGVHDLRQATDEEIAQLGSVVGFVSPLNLKIKKVGDSSLKTVQNFSTGADEFQKDTINVNYPRDFKVDIETDIANAVEGSSCPKCKKKKLKATPAIEWGNIFKYDHFYTDPMKGFFRDEDGQEKPAWMGAYGIGLGRSVAAIAETHNDDKGIMWPKEVAPFHVHLLSVGKDKKVAKDAEVLYNEMLAQKIEVLWDDRDISPGEKFADSDLLGIPIRLVISEKTMAKQQYEWKARDSQDLEMIGAGDLMKKIKKYYQS